MPQINPSEENEKKAEEIIGLPTEEDMATAMEDLMKKRPDWTHEAVREFVGEEARAYRKEYKLLIENQELYEQARTDALTEIPNKRAYNETIEREIGHAERGNPLSVIMIDIDKFKDFNTEFGHKIGDKILIKVAKILEKGLHRKKTDMIARYGGEEFVAILPGANEENVKEIAERLRESIEDETRNMEPKGVTISLGYATYKKNSGQLNSADKLTEAADIALYHAKVNGRNQTAEFKEGMEQPDKEEGLSVETLQIEFDRIEKEFNIKKRNYSRLIAIKPKNDEEAMEINEELGLIAKEAKLIEIRMSDLLAEKVKKLKIIQKSA